MKYFIIVMLLFSCSVFDDRTINLDDYSLQEFEQGALGHKYIIDIVRWYNSIINYEDDPDDEWKFPLETLRDGGGDCEDYSILLAYIMEYYYDQTAYVIILVEYGKPAAHAIVEINGKMYEPQSGWYYDMSLGYEVERFTIEEALEIAKWR